MTIMLNIMIVVVGSFIGTSLAFLVRHFWEKWTWGKIK